jgi:hypothetical protein
MIIAASMASVRRAAERLIVRHTLEPPVDVLTLTEIYADVERLSWPISGCDGLTYLLPGESRPKIFYRSTDNPQRERFTVCHELAHAILPWHLARGECRPDEEGDIFRVATLENQADLFASCLLFPDRWLRSIVSASQGDGSRLLNSLAEADASTIASLIAVRRTLLAGWVFQAYAGTLTVSSAGTYLPQGASPKELRAEAVDAGEARMNGHTVNWYRLTDNDSLPAAAMDGEAKEMLQAALQILEPDPTLRPRITQQLNGKVGGGLRNAGGGDADVLFNQLRYRIRNSPFASFLSEPLFEQWLGMKARDIARGSTVRLRQKR